MKVAFIKHIYNLHGPWSTVLWKDSNPTDLFIFWPSKALFWEMTCLLKADWYIVSSARFKGDYLKGAMSDRERIKIANKYVKKVVSFSEIPYENYDLLITLDPILEVPPRSRTLFVYYIQEDWDNLYRKSLRRPLGKYDLFLAHMMDSNSEILSMPQAVSFPYLYSLEVAQSVFSSRKKEMAWIDWRTLTTLAQIDSWAIEAEKAAKRLERLLEFPIYYRGDFNRTPLGVSDPPLWGDAANYFKEMSKCKYYIGVGRKGGAGQALGDAASLGCVCIGDISRPYHRLTCHPQLLCKDIFDLPDIFRKVVNSPELQKEALEYQKKALKEKFERKPLELIKEAIQIKHKSL
ncbi:hypothetical protein J7K44_00665 [bacterium]|nr:hypothetical protein [bacterium]